MSTVEFPLSFVRQYDGPLDASAVFSTLFDLNTYVSSDPTAYAGQVVSVSTGVDAGVYIISENVDSVQKQVTNSDIANMVSSTDITNIVKLTQAEYDALTTPDESTMYAISG